MSRRIRATIVDGKVMKTPVGLLTNNPPKINAAQKTNPANSKKTNLFSKTLNNASLKLQQKQTTIKSPKSSLYLGTITRRTPTVSDLVFNNEETADKGWSIIHSAVNQGKPFTRIPAGTPIYFNPQNNEIFWNDSSSPTKSSVSNSQELLHEPAAILTARHSLATAGKQNSSKTPPVSLGTINSETPTVSHLLKNHPDYKDTIWKTLALEVNQGKSFNQIPTGTRIYIDSQSGSITWDGTPPPPKTQQFDNSPLPGPAGKTPFLAPPSKADENSANLTDAVQPYIGKSYKEIDCYALLVEGLKNMGIPYSGKTGLQGTLISMAKAKGLPANAYLNGEGIVEAAGSKVLSHSVNNVENWTEEAGKVINRMSGLLQKGQILSFSTPTRGHTGIISQHNNQWTFINSGRMDNPVEKAASSREVGEEDLIHEIENWFKTAKRNNEPLLVTLGQLEADKIRNRFNPDFQQTRRL